MQYLWFVYFISGVVLDASSSATITIVWHHYLEATAILYVAAVIEAPLPGREGERSCAYAAACCNIKHDNDDDDDDDDDAAMFILQGDGESVMIVISKYCTITITNKQYYPHNR